MEKKGHLPPGVEKITWRKRHVLAGKRGRRDRNSYESTASEEQLQLLMKPKQPLPVAQEPQSELKSTDIEDSEVKDELKEEFLLSEQSQKASKRQSSFEH